MERKYRHRVIVTRPPTTTSVMIDDDQTADWLDKMDGEGWEFVGSLIAPHGEWWWIFRQRYHP
jgi:hypothetical protein